MVGAAVSDGEDFILNEVAELEAERHRGAGKLPIPSYLDKKVFDVVSAWIALGPASRDTVASLFDERHSFTFITVAQRFAQAVTTLNSMQYLRVGLAALVLEGGKFDLRENLLAMRALYDAALKLGADPSDLFNEAASLLDNEVSRSMRAFPSRQ
jgi:hypothetical protein